MAEPPLGNEAIAKLRRPRRFPFLDDPHHVGIVFLLAPVIRTIARMLLPSTIMPSGAVIALYRMRGSGIPILW
jgi:hypothetical protein